MSRATEAADAGALDLSEFIDKMAEVRYLTYDSHASMAGGLSWEEYKAEDGEVADALYVEDVRHGVMHAAPQLMAALYRAGFRRIA